MITDILGQLKRDEGFRADVYIDTVGKRTIGYGHNLDANPLYLMPPISEYFAEVILRTDVQNVADRLVELLPWTRDWEQLDDARYGVLLNMGFNLGIIGLVGFHHMLTFLHDGDYENAALSMTQSKWYHQVGNRAKRLVEQMRLGQWQ